MLIEGALESGLEIASPTNDDERSAIVSLKIPDGFDTGEVVKQLQDEYGILVTNRSGFLRVSPHIDNTSEQITFFLESLRTILNIFGGDSRVQGVQVRPVCLFRAEGILQILQRLSSHGDRTARTYL